MPHTESKNKKIITKTTWVGLIANLALFLIKFVLGTMGNSYAIVADAFHSLSDMLTDIAILVGVKFWSDPADENHPHGHKKIEILITFAIGLSLLTVGVGILWNSLTTIHKHNTSNPSLIALVAAIVSIIVKELLYRWTVKIGKRIKSMALLANAWHHRSDALSSLPAGIAVTVAIYIPSWSFIDHIGAFFVSIFIIQAAFKIVFPAFSKLVDVGISKSEKEIVSKIILETDGIINFHKIRTRYISSTDVAIDFHMEVDGNLTVNESYEIYKNIKNKLLSCELPIVDVIIHIEPHRKL